VNRRVRRAHRNPNERSNYFLITFNSITTIAKQITSYKTDVQLLVFGESVNYKNEVFNTEKHRVDIKV
jgi:predicted nucleotidyltransferase